MEALEEIARWHQEQACWHRHAAAFEAADKPEPIRSMLLDAATMHERFAATLRTHHE